VIFQGRLNILQNYKVIQSELTNRISSGLSALVTFVLLVYNNEKTIIQSLKSVINQDYDFLELIVHDDCSIDDTLQLITKFLKGVSRPGFEYKVIASEANVGTLTALRRAAKHASGALIVCGAGDDLSKPERVRKIREHWIQTRAWGLYSCYELISEEGCILKDHDSINQYDRYLAELRSFVNNLDDNFEFIHGATSAYDKKIFEMIESMPDYYVLAEDGALSIVIALFGGKTVKVDGNLVRYRLSNSSLTNGKPNSDKYSDLAADEDKIKRLNSAQFNRCIFYIDLFSLTHYDLKLTLNIKKTMRAASILSAKSTWWEKSFTDRLVFLFTNRLNNREFKWFLGRILPLPIFLGIKMIIKSCRKQILR
jgi:glycosyltransferase involved in cell wall biosynthesis